MPRKQSALTYIILFSSIFMFSKYVSWAAMFPVYILGILLFLIHKKSISKKLLWLSLIPLMLVLLGTFSISSGSGTKAILRDGFYYIQPLALLVFSYLLAHRIASISFLVKIFVYSGVVLAFAHFIDIMIHPDYLLSGDFFKDRIKSSHIVPIAFAFLLINFKKKIFNLPKLKASLFLFILLLSVILSFSRTMFIVVAIILLFGLGFIKFNTKKILMGVFLLTGLGVFINAQSLSIENDEKTLFTKFARSLTEMQLQDYDERRDINVNWRGYEAYMGLQAYLNDGNVFNYIFGYGFGKGADLGVFISLGGKEFNEISVFHNGYINILLKTGFLGVLFYSFYWLYLFSKTYNNKALGLGGNLLASMLISMLFLTAVVSGWLNNAMNMPFIMFYAMSYNLLNNTKKEN